jgi:hypothetical protein
MRFTLLRRSLFLSLALSGPTGIAANAATAAEPVETLLERQTQELLDAVAPGRVEVWQRLLHPDAIYVSENGEVILKYTIRRDGTRLFGRRAGRDESELELEAPDVLFIAGQPRSRKVMTRDDAGRVSGFADRREGHDIVWTRVRSNGS